MFEKIFFWVVIFVILGAMIYTVYLTNAKYKETIISNVLLTPRIKYFVENNKVDSVYIYEKESR